MGDAQDLFLFRGGPFYALQRAAGFVGSRGEMLARRAPFFVLAAWLPLVVLAALQGLAIGPSPAESMLLCLSVHARYLVALPLLLLAENIADARFVTVAQHFFGAGLVRPADVERFSAAALDAKRLRDSRTVEALLFGIAVAIAIAAVFADLHDGKPSWRSVGPPGAQRISLAGAWALVFSQPLFVFILARWLWRLVIWGIFLRRVARLDLALVPAHPDAAGGLGFLARSPQAFEIVVFALSAVLAATWADAYFHHGIDLRVHRTQFVLFVVLNELLLLAPLLTFLGPLQRCKHASLSRYGELGAALLRRFDERWLDGSEGGAPELLERPDPSALADYASVYGAVKNMRPVPFGRTTLVMVAVAAALPMLPLIPIVIPLPQLLGQLAKALL